MNPQLTVVIPTLNEESDLAETLTSVTPVATEILVIDSGSQDRTVEIAHQFKAKVISHPFSSFSETRNHADLQAQGDWILSIEADVTVPPELATEILSVLQTNLFDAYYIGRQSIIWGAPVYHADWSPTDDRHIWLYRRGSGRWSGLVHEEYETSGRVGKLKNILVHKNYVTVSEYLDKINRYSDLAIRQKQSFPKWWFLREFFKRYVYKLGFLDGYRGLFLSYLQGVYYLTLMVKRYTRST
jgi:glycosyltransferase involved in cell wall biosynthesis